MPDHLKHEYESYGIELTELKERIKKSGKEVMLDYPAKFLNNKVHGLEAFASRLFDVLWNAISSLQKKPPQAAEEKMITELQKHCNFCKSVSNFFVGRHKTLESVHETLKKAQNGTIQVYGVGTTSFLATLAWKLMKSGKKSLIIPYFPQVANARKISQLLRFLKTTLKHFLNIQAQDSLMENAKFLAKDVCTLLQSASDHSKLILVIDEFDRVEMEEGILTEWIPSQLENILIVFSSRRNSLKFNRWISARKDKISTINLENLTFNRQFFFFYV